MEKQFEKACRYKCKNEQAKKNQRVINILLQIKISNDESKSGLSFNETQNILNNHEQVNIKIIGLMGMGSLDMNKNESEFIEISNFYQKSKDRFNFIQGKTFYRIKIAFTNCVIVINNLF